jgi:hypothetical protein
VKIGQTNLALIGIIVVFSSALTGCGTTPARDFGGSWKPVNHFEEKTTEIPLAVPYTYYAAPMDGTLKTMLTRWTTDNGMKLQYKLRSDFTLTKSASAIHTSELRDAASQLSSIYSAQGVAITVDGPDLVVDEVSAITAPPSSAPAPSAPPVEKPAAAAPATDAAPAAAPEHVAVTDNK